jgi:hypothetical protein
MNLESRKIDFVQHFLQIDSEKVLEAVENFFYKTKSELFEESLKKPMSIQKFNDEIDQSLNDEEKGNILKSSDLKKKIKKWS